MENSGDYLEYFYQIFSYISDYNAYVFIFSLLTFGFITYFYSIKVTQPTFEGQKNIKKRGKKDKVIKVKNIIKDSNSKLEILNDCQPTRSDLEKKVADSEPTEKDDNEHWIPVQKPKKTWKQNNKKSAKSSTEVPREIPMKTTIAESKSTDCDNISSVKEIIKCEEIEVKQEVAVEVVEEDESMEQQEEIKEEEEDNEENDEEVEEEVEVGVPRLTESPTNSSSDDFVLVDGSKMSSDEALIVEVTEESVAATGRTSGASRKKNKKHQKVISKQLIEAAIVEGDEKQVVSEEVCVPVLKTAQKVSVVGVVTAAKKRRARKDD